MNALGVTLRSAEHGGTTELPPHESLPSGFRKKGITLPQAADHNGWKRAVIFFFTAFFHFFIFSVICGFHITWLALNLPASILIRLRLGLCTSARCTCGRGAAGDSMRPDTKVKVARRKHTVELLRWLYSRRDANLDGARLSFDHRHRQQGGLAGSRPLTYGEVSTLPLALLHLCKRSAYL